ncbi:unnamed protein product [Rotaria sordida]|uniref:Uncharacterized protein n=1 Tax=Rotaria sordida TaxID=392033 RepID=A0A815ETM8_9BILA|nr:unnamed protein product [Rotaria sordida]
MAIFPYDLFEDEKYRSVMIVLGALGREEVKQNEEKNIDTSIAIKIIGRLLAAYRHPTSNIKLKREIDLANEHREQSIVHGS